MCHEVAAANYPLMNGLALREQTADVSAGAASEASV
jgi:hypothetical protein